MHGGDIGQSLVVDSSAIYNTEDHGGILTSTNWRAMMAVGLPLYKGVH
jgi:hypothetical protein